MKNVYLAPNSLTSANLLCGAISIMMTLSGRYLGATLFIFIGLLFDFLDGTVARRLHATSHFGREYDSISDMVTFGVAGPMLVYKLCLTGTGLGGMLLTSAYMICGAFRLARYNVQNPRRGAHKLLGLPINASCVCLIVFSFAAKWVFRSLTVFLTSSSLVFFAFLMISKVSFVKDEEK